MNDVLQNVMTFINENTYILIGICIFLIFVLIGYLIDNSVKSKRVRKDIKNKDQVPENIKNEIIEEATKEKDQIVNIENTKEETDNKEIDTVNIVPDVSLNVDTKENSTDDLVKLNQDIPLNLDIESSVNTESISQPFNLDIPTVDTTINVDSLSSGLSLEEPVYDNINDPDSNIMINNEDKEYSNDKKLSEILSQMDKTSSNIFQSNVEPIELNKNVDNNVEIQSSESVNDELERIMKKLSSMTSQDEDNYTNIF